MGNYLGEKELSELPSKQQYAIFDKADVSCDDNSFYTLAKNHIQKQPWLKNVSNKILSALCYAHKKNKEGNFKGDDCDYLYFWLGEILDRNLTNRHSFYAVMHTFKYLLESHGGLIICNYDKYDMTEKNFMDIKHLFDFSKDYDMLKTYFDTPKESCSDSFNIYISERVIKYNACKNSCDVSNRKDVTCSAFDKYFSGKKQMNLLKWTCNSGGNPASLAEGQQNNEGVSQTQVQEEVHRMGAEAQLQQRQETQPELQQQLEALPLEEKEEELLQIQAHTALHMQVPLRSTPADKSGQQLMQEISENIDFPVESPESETFIGISYRSSDYSSSENMVISPLAIGIAVLSIILCKVFINANKK
ncbi:variable surface protein [Plasmodium gonderi]|uniref:Variable surface protein n=1 Tax=Plasmodium gonderi TaxID=77519 RepID=A0A1Y1JUC6_PLAGO|nr:variable surface protein [Plasmodium gonderi]GAW84352.1 variable surface protein [Plasmodium gonderi]